MLRTVWKGLASVKLTIYLLFLVAANLAVGALHLRFLPDLFRPLNKMAFGEWWAAYPTGHSWWIFLLLFLLFLLGMNTVACTLDRLTELWLRRRDYRFRVFFYKLCPSLTHVFFLLALSGHALSVFWVTHQEFPIQKGSQVTLPGLALTVKDAQADYWDSPLLPNPLRQCTVTLDVTTSKGDATQEIRFLHPLHVNGWTLHLDANPKVPPNELKLILLAKKDPGHVLILLGGLLFSLVMVWYFLELTRNKMGEST